MKTLSYIIYTLCLLSVFSCKKDLISTTVTNTSLNETISGTVWIDSDSDEKGDSYYRDTDGTVRIYWGDIDLINDILGEKPDTLESPYDEILWADLDSHGQYIMEGVPPIADQHLVLSSPIPVKQIFARDNTPDGDELEEEIGTHIAITIEMDEYDDGNDFVVQLISNASGYILEDTDNDGIGDTPAVGHEVRFYKRDENGLPFEEYIIGTLSNEEGFYTFGPVPEGEYIIEYQSPYGFSSISGTDNSPEPDEPTVHAETHYIQVDVSDRSIEDTDNDFVVATSWSASGYVLHDTNGDGAGDLGLAGFNIELYERDAGGFPSSALITSATTDENGLYQFEQVPEGEYVIQYTGPSEYFVSVSTDFTPETGEPGTSPDAIFIPMNVNAAGIEDMDNNFIVIENVAVISISGFTLLDTNDDDIGDEGVDALRLELYKRNEDGVPMGSLIKEDYSNEDGYFEFRNIPAGEYVIYYIGDPFHIIIKSEDESPEAGEPDPDAGLIFIQVDLLTNDAEDSDNIYTLKKA